MKAQLDANNLIWLWQKVPTKLCDLSTKNLKFIKFMVTKKALKNNNFWNGVHYTGYVEAIDQILRKRSNDSLPTDSNLEKDALHKADRFLGELSSYFPKSKLAVSIKQSINNSNQIINQVTKETV